MKATQDTKNRNELLSVLRVSTMNRRHCPSEADKEVQIYVVDPRSPPFGDWGRITFGNVGNLAKQTLLIMQCVNSK